MKKYALLVLVFATACIAGFESCQSSKSAAATKMLKFDLENGKGYDYEMILNMDQEIMGQKMQMDMSTYYSMDVNAEDSGIKTITTKIDRFKLKTTVAGFNLEVDTDNPPVLSGSDPTDTSSVGNPLEMVNKLFGAIKGRKFSMKVNPEGKVVSVSGFEDMAAALVDSMNVDPSEREKVMKEFDKQFNGEQIKEQMERFWYIFPNKEVKVGDSWQKSTKRSGEMPGNYNSTYEVKEIEGDMVTLSEITKVDSEQQAMNLKGEITGTIVVDSRYGLVVSANQDMDLTATAEGKSFKIKGKSKIKGKAR